MINGKAEDFVSNKVATNVIDTLRLSSNMTYERSTSISTQTKCTHTRIGFTYTPQRRDRFSAPVVYITSAIQRIALQFILNRSDMKQL